jgi:uncharacterized membrane protein
MTPVAKTVVRSALGVAVTTGLAYLFDPESGQRRRQSLRDQCASTAKRMGDGVRVKTYDLTHKLNGVSARMKSKLSRDKSSDPALTKRVYAALWRALPHPGAIHVVAHEGHVILYGDIVHAEHRHAVEIVRSVDGVREVSDQLEEKAAAPDGREGLTTVKRAMMTVRQFPMLKETWSPSTRVFSGVTAGALLAWAVTHRNPVGALTGVAGAALLLRSGANVPFRRMIRPARREIAVHKVIEVNTPVAVVFERLTDYENFPAFMRSARSIRRITDDKSHWTLSGPGGAANDWDLQTTLKRPHEVLAWRSITDGTVGHTGIVRFSPLGSDRTRLDVQLTYSASAKSRGDVLAELLGSDPGHEVEADLARMKIFLETGAAARKSGAESEQPVPAGARSRPHDVGLAAAAGSQ